MRLPIQFRPQHSPPPSLNFVAQDKHLFSHTDTELLQPVFWPLFERLTLNCLGLCTCTPLAPSVLDPSGENNFEIG